MVKSLLAGKHNKNYFPHFLTRYLFVMPNFYNLKLGDITFNIMTIKREHYLVILYIK
jgi:hypothetical protein